MQDVPPVVSDLQERIGYKFVNSYLLSGALTHPSAGIDKISAKHGAGYERLEFLGDRVLGLVVAELLGEQFPDDDEGALSKRLVALVRKEALLDVARCINLHDEISLAAGAGRAYERHRETAAADGVEALIGAIFRDGGYKAAAAFVRRWWAPLLKRYQAPPKDPKTTLQEWAQARSLPLPSYHVLKMDGPAHQPVFVVEATLAEVGVSQAEGRSKRIAEQMAAKTLLKRAEESAVA